MWGYENNPMYLIFFLSILEGSNEMSEQEKQEPIKPEQYTASNLTLIIQEINKALAQQTYLPGFTEHRIKSILNQIFDDLNQQEQRDEEKERFVRRATEFVSLFPSLVRQYEAYYAYLSNKETLADFVNAAVVMTKAENLLPLQIHPIDDELHRPKLLAAEATFEDKFTNLLMWLNDGLKVYNDEERPYTFVFLRSLLCYFVSAYKELAFVDRVGIDLPIEHKEYIYGGLPALDTTLTSYSEYIKAAALSTTDLDTTDLSRPFGQSEVESVEDAEIVE